MEILQFKRLKIIKTNFSLREIMYSFPNFEGSGAYRDVYSNEEEELVLKVPNGNSYDDEDLVTLDFHFFYNDKNEKVDFYYPEDVNVNSSMLCNIKEALIYENCEDDLVYLLCPIYCLIITKEGIPLSFAKKCEGDFDYFVENIFYTSDVLDLMEEEVKSEKRFEDDPLANYMEITGSNSIDILCRYLNKEKSLICKIKEDLSQIVSKFHLNYEEQFDNWGNIGFDAQGNVYMLDFN